VSTVNTVRTVLAATDFSDDAGHAVARAALLASEQQAALELIHVLHEPWLAAVKSLLKGSVDIEERLVGDATQALQKVAAGILQAHGLKADQRVIVGAVVEEVLAAGSRADLIAVGGHGANPLRDLVLGSTAERLLGQRTKPVLVVKRPPERPYRRVLLAMDLPGSSAAALDLAMSLAPRADITILHAYSVPFEGKLSLAGVPEVDINKYRSEAARLARWQIESLIRTGAKGRTGIVPAVAHGDATFLILNKQEELDADLIVLGCRRQSSVELFFLGSVSRHVLADAKCDVLVSPDQALA
jgi:nucleotide-binding universal stress UspA family protein